MKLNSVLASTVSVAAIMCCTLLVSSKSVHAQVFSGNSLGRWGTPTPGKNNPNAFFTYEGNNSFSWGKPYFELFKSPPNRLTFNGNSFSSGLNNWFQVGTLEYFNGIVPLGTNVESVPMQLDLSFLNPIQRIENFKFNFEIDTTRNNSLNEDENADQIAITSDLNPIRFTYNGKKYILELNGFSVDGNLTPIDKLRVTERASDQAGIYARIKTVPEPSAIAGLSLLGLYLASRKMHLKSKFRIL